MIYARILCPSYFECDLTVSYTTQEDWGKTASKDREGTIYICSK